MPAADGQKETNLVASLEVPFLTESCQGFFIIPFHFFCFRSFVRVLWLPTLWFNGIPECVYEWVSVSISISHVFSFCLFCPICLLLFYLFILYYILFYYYLLNACFFFSNKRRKGGGSGWEEKRGGAARSIRKGTITTMYYMSKNIFSIKK